MLTGDNSLLGNAQKTGPVNKIGAAKDEIGLAYNSAMQEYYQDKYASGKINGDITFASKFASKMEDFTKAGAETSNPKNHGCTVEYRSGKITIKNDKYQVVGHVDITGNSGAGIDWGITTESENGKIIYGELESGLYQTGTKNLIKTWEELKKDGDITVVSGTWYTYHINDNGYEYDASVSTADGTLTGTIEDFEADLTKNGVTFERTGTQNEVQLLEISKNLAGDLVIDEEITKLAYHYSHDCHGR